MSSPGRSCALACAPRRRDRDFRRQGFARSPAAAHSLALGPRFRGDERRGRGLGGGWSRRRGRSRLGGGRARRRATLAGDDRDHRADRRDVARLHPDLGERARGDRRHLHRNLVGLDLEQVVARLYGSAGRDEPLGDLALGDGLAELRHQDVHSNPLNSRTVTLRSCRLAGERSEPGGEKPAVQRSHLPTPRASRGPSPRGEG